MTSPTGQCGRTPCCLLPFTNLPKMPKLRGRRSRVGASVISMYIVQKLSPRLRMKLLSPELEPSQRLDLLAEIRPGVERSGFETQLARLSPAVKVVSWVSQARVAHLVAPLVSLEALAAMNEVISVDESSVVS